MPRAAQKGAQLSTNHNIGYVNCRKQLIEMVVCNLRLAVQVRVLPRESILKKQVFSL
jgi:hypothetical protein